MSISQVRQNFHEDCEVAINRQINMELYASYTYMAMVITEQYVIEKYSYEIRQKYF